MTTFYAQPGRNQSTRTIVTRESDIVDILLDFSATSYKHSTSVSAVTWTVESGQASVSNAAENNDVAEARISTPQSGTSHIRVQATYADGQRASVMLKVICKPLPRSAPDYWDY